MIAYLVFLGIFLVLAVFSGSSRRDLVKPEYSTFRVMVYIGFYLLADYVFGIPLKGYETLEIVVSLSIVTLFPIMLFGEHYGQKWWKVSERS